MSRFTDTAGATFNTALAYARRGWSVIPIPHRSKNPGRKGWEQLRLTVNTVAQHFNGASQNIGVLLGEPSGWIIDVDVDHSGAVTLAPDFLPPTPAVFGRASKPRSHWVYRVSAPVATIKAPQQVGRHAGRAALHGRADGLCPLDARVGRGDRVGGRGDRPQPEPAKRRRRALPAIPEGPF